MKAKSLIIWSALILCGCGNSDKPPEGSGGLYGQMQNIREFGIVVSVTQSENTAPKAINAQSGSFMQSINGTFTSLKSSLTGEKESTVSHLHYVIRKDNGQQVTVDQTPDAGEAIIYPGQRVMIQMNGNYIKVYPADIENRLKP